MRGKRGPGRCIMYTFTLDYISALNVREIIAASVLSIRACALVPAHSYCANSHCLSVFCYFVVVIGAPNVFI